MEDRNDTRRRIDNFAFTVKQGALESIKELYNTPDGDVGGYAHIVTDDGNIEDGYIESCLDDAHNARYNEFLCEETRIASIKCLNALKNLSEEEREEVIEKYFNTKPEDL